jgi:uncharacterized protein with PIN domain
MKDATCGWCLTHVKVPDHYDPLRREVYCCKQCFQADWMFRQWMSDEEINRRLHYQILTKGGDP